MSEVAIRYATFTTLNFSRSKRQHTVLAEVSGADPVVLKMCYPGGEQFEKEKAFYLERPPFAFVPPASMVNSSVIALPFFSAPTVRQYADTVVADPRRDPLACLWRVADLFLRDLRQFLSPVRLTPSATEVERLVKTLGNLLCSGPMGTRRPKAMDLLARRTWRMMMPVFQRALEQDFREPESTTRTWCHGDLHLNNILFDERDGRLVWIDWGTSYQGQPWRDLMYSTAMFAAILEELSPGSAAKLHERVAREVLEEGTPGAVRYLRWAPLYTLFASANSRFTVGGREGRALWYFGKIIRLTLRSRSGTPHDWWAARGNDPA